MRSRNLHAFTLVEVAIVLIVIGLVIGAVLSGRDLIRAAQVRLQAGQMEKLNTAMASFRTKYNCLPGDCAKAVELGLGVASGDGDDGDGSGYVESTAVNALDGPELSNFWIHLSNAGMISWSGVAGNVPGINSPPLMLKGQAVITDSTTQNASGGVWLAEIADTSTLPARISGWILAASNTASNPVYLPADAYGLDVKIDDGGPDTGIMNSMGYFNRIICPGGPCLVALMPTASENGLGNTCINDLVVPIVYDLTTTNPATGYLCEPAIRWSN